MSSKLVTSLDQTEFPTSLGELTLCLAFLAQVLLKALTKAIMGLRNGTQDLEGGRFEDVTVMGYS